MVAAAIGRRILAVLVLACGLAAAAFAEPPIPPLSGRVVDQAGILDGATVEALTSQLAGFESSTGIQVVVVTLADLNGYPIEDWGLTLGRRWAIGQAGKDNGVLLIVAPRDRALRIEVGYGLEGDLPDATANGIIQQEIIPHFKRGDMKGGIRAGVNAILAALDGGYQPVPFSADRQGGLSITPFKILVFIAIAFALIRGGGGGYGRGSRSRGGGFRSSGFRGGGGSFGGGGASGRW